MKKSNLILVFISLLLGISCQDADMVMGGDCGSTSKVVKRVKDQRGMLYYNEMEKTYAISVALPQTYDVVDIGLLCNLPEEYKIPNKEREITWVIFSGKYGKSEKVAAVVSATYYNLELTKIKFEES